MRPNLRQYFYRGQDPQRVLRTGVLAAGLVTVLLLAGAFYLGEQAAYSGLRLDPRRYHDMQGEIPQLREQIVALEAELGAQRTRAAVDQQALEIVRKDLAAQNEEIASLEEGLRFYRSLMAPGEIAQGLSLRPLELVALDDPSQFGFRIVAQQEARKHALLNAELHAEVLGTLDGKEASYYLADLSADLEDRVVALRFRYFQSIEGVMTLPQGFEPRWVVLRAVASTPRKMEVEERFPWRVKEKFTNVGS